MSFYIPAQSSDGTLLGDIDYYKPDGTLFENRDFAKPLVAVYIDALPETKEDSLERELVDAGIYSGTSFGTHDAYAALSLDGGSPTYSFNDDEVDALKVGFGLPDRYVHDIWGVAGSQSSVDYTLQGFPEVGEIPYSCVWSARCQLLQDDDTGLFDIVWSQAERLTSGRRDANRLELNADGAAGFMMTWQEDPEGPRPGQGWSGTVVNQQTDLGYSYICLVDFVMVQTADNDETPISIYAYTGDTIPKVAVPMVLPIRLTDNKMCKATGSDPYCYIDFDNVDADGNLILPDGLATITQSADSTFCPNGVRNPCSAA